MLSLPMTLLPYEDFLGRMRTFAVRVILEIDYYCYDFCYIYWVAPPWWWFELDANYSVLLPPSGCENCCSCKAIFMLLLPSSIFLSVVFFVMSVFFFLEPFSMRVLRGLFYFMSSNLLVTLEELRGSHAWLLETTRWEGGLQSVTATATLLTSAAAALPPPNYF